MDSAILKSIRDIIMYIQFSKPGFIVAKVSQPTKYTYKIYVLAPAEDNDIYLEFAYKLTKGIGMYGYSKTISVEIKDIVEQLLEPKKYIESYSSDNSINPAMFISFCGVVTLVEDCIYT